MSPRTRVIAMLAAIACLLAPAAPATAIAAQGTPGAPGAGDSYFPADGNGGYDVTHYAIDMGYDPKLNRLDATTRITARATQDLSRFDLDLKQLDVKDVTVGGHTAEYRRDGQEPVITPPHEVTKDSKFEVAVRYAGTPEPIDRPDIGKFGWIKTPDGAYVVSEPNAASTWFPNNDHPSDKASYTFRVTVPKGTTVLSNGELTEQTSEGASSTFVWDAKEPMASYLAMLAIGDYKIKTGKTAGGIPVLTAVSGNRADEADFLFQSTVKAVDWEEKVFGRYPFSTTGGIRVGVDVAFSLETQTRPIYGFKPDQGVVVHELAHQWFGDSVSVGRWKDIWLNEGFATYAEWLYDEQHGGKTAQQTFDQLYNLPESHELWGPVLPGDPGASSMFTLPPYYRGGLTLQAVRQRIGDKAFFELLKTWTTQKRDANAATPEFIALAEKISGKDLKNLFQVWLYTKGKPKSW